MREYTQTTFGDRGNCFQTAIACVLEVEPASLPDQSACDRRGPDGRRQEPYFQNLLQAYLRKHHGLAYFDRLPSTILSVFAFRDPGYHFLSGTTVRTGTLGAAERHIVVARHGKMVWDPHPSRAGLIDDVRISVLAPHPPEWDQHVALQTECECPPCQRERSAG